MNKTILVTGGAGFIGSNFAKALRVQHPDSNIIVVDELTYAGSMDNLLEFQGDERFEFVHGNVRNGELMDDLVSRSQIVYHFAAESHVTRSIYDNRVFFETDVLGTQVLANAAVKHRDNIELFVHISTSEVYGTAESALMEEEHPLMPLSPYAAAKCGADRLIYSYWSTYQLPAVIIRPFNNYGPNQHLEKAVPRFISSCILKQPVTVHGDGQAARDWLHVTDNCRALLRLLEVPVSSIQGEVINIGTARSLTVLQIAEIVTETMGIPKSKISFIGNRPGQVFRHTAAIAKAKRLLDWEPTIEFEEGIKSVAQWYQDNPKWWEHQIWMRQIPIITAEGKKELH